jgi:hypothetical protein
VQGGETMTSTDLGPLAQQVPDDLWIATVRSSRERRVLPIVNLQQPPLPARRRSSSRLLPRRAALMASLRIA